MYIRLRLLLLALPLIAQAQDAPLDRYVQQGLEHNLTLQQRQLDVMRSRRALDEARGQLLPSLSLEARYTRAAGGRTIDFPVGDLLNPVYSTLNDLTEQPSFPTIGNEQINFLRDREQETNLRFVQPVYQPALLHNYRMRRSLTQAEEASVDARKRQLVADVKTAYFGYLKADRVVDIYDATQQLVAENLRVNQRLFEHGKATKDAVYRAQAEVRTVEQQKAQAETNRDLATSRFNILLNRPLNASIEHLPIDVLLDDTEASLAVFASPNAALSTTRDDLAAIALHRRDELAQLDYAVDAAESNLRLTRSAFLPSVSFVLDYGIQGTSYRFTDDADFRTASVVLDWNLFNGFQDRARMQRVRLQQRALETEREALTQQIRLQVQEASDHVAVARRSITTAEERVRSAEQSFRLVRRRYEEGMASQVDFIDARTTLTNAQLNLALTQYDLLIRYAELERVAALYPLP